MAYCRSSQAAGLLLCLWITQSCVHRAPIDQQQFKLPNKYHPTKSTNDQRSPILRYDRWWQVFNDKQLNALVKIANRESPDLAIMRARIDQAQAQLQLAGGTFLPTINGVASAGRQRRILSDQFQFTANQFNLSLAASYEFNLGGRAFYARDAAAYGLKAAEYDLDASRITLTANVVEAYFLVVERKAQLALLEQTVASRKTQLGLIKERYQQGVAQALDVYQAQENLAAAKAQRAQAKGQLDHAMHALTLAIGHYPGEFQTTTIDALPVQIKSLPEHVPGQLLLQRPDLRAGYHRLLASNERVGEAFAAHFPTLSFTPALGQSFDPTGFFWSILGQLTAPLFQGGQIQAQYQAQKAILREQTAAFKAALLQAVKEVRDAVVAGQAVTEQIRWLKERTQAAADALRLASAQYMQGILPYINVLIAEQNLFGARSQLLAARRELISARVQLCRALGGGWHQTTADGSSQDDRPRQRS